MTGYPRDWIDEAELTILALLESIERPDTGDLNTTFRSLVDDTPGCLHDRRNRLILHAVSTIHALLSGDDKFRHLPVAEYVTTYRRLFLEAV